MDFAINLKVVAISIGSMFYQRVYLPLHLMQGHFLL